MGVSPPLPVPVTSTPLPRLLPVLPTFNAQALANTAWAYATLGVHHRPLLRAIADRALDPTRGRNRHRGRLSLDQ